MGVVPTFACTRATCTTTRTGTTGITDRTMPNRAIELLLPQFGSEYCVCQSMDRLLRRLPNESNVRTLGVALGYGTSTSNLPPAHLACHV
jgi:hypothetical protein